MTSRPERRVAPRFDLRAPAEYRAGELTGQGTIWNISASGLRLENATQPVTEGAKVEVQLSYYPGSFEIALRGEVVRLTEGGGFAIRFLQLGRTQVELLRRVLPLEAWALQQT